MLLFAKPRLAIKGVSVATRGNEVVWTSRLLISDCDFMNTSGILPEAKAPDVHHVGCSTDNQGVVLSREPV